MTQRYIPQEIIDRPKMGFGAPIGDWMRGPMRDWAEHHLSRDRLAQSGIHPTQVLQRWREHLDGTSNWQYPLWDVIVYQAWAEEWQKTEPEAVSGSSVGAAVGAPDTHGLVAAAEHHPSGSPSAARLGSFGTS